MSRPCLSVCLWLFVALPVSEAVHAQTAQTEAPKLPVQAPKEPHSPCEAAAADWIAWDSRKTGGSDFRSLAESVLNGEASDAAELRRRRDAIVRTGIPAGDEEWRELYFAACRHRRQKRLGPHLDRLRRIVFTKHHDLGGQHYAYTEDVSDSPYNDSNPFPHGGALCLLEMDGIFGSVRVLLEEPDGLIRDPDVSYDGMKILFARRTDMIRDDYHLYEMDVATEKVRRLTSGEEVADYEGAYLPNGHIVFNSTRCQQIVDCWWSDVSNLYTCDGDGRFLRRLTFDQVHTNYPQVLPDGRVVYTRWDYNDRGQIFPQPLFQMNPDGTAQQEFYGNNSWFPTTILHARGIPGTQKVICILSGHHTYQRGKLAIIDPAEGRQENEGVRLIAPVRATAAVQIDRYGYQGEQFQYPFPLSETEFLVSYSPDGGDAASQGAKDPFGVYWMDVDGRRELLVADPAISCNQAIPLAPRTRPPVRASVVDYRRDTGTYSLHDIYRGPGLAGIPRGTIKQLRVVALEFRAAGIGHGRNQGPAGGALISTPISIEGAWDVKRVLGTTPIHEDGSAAFTVPARTPVYFQALDANGHVVQTMRSWSTLQPGETFACVGCHEHKNASPPSRLTATEAMRGGPRPLEPEGMDPESGFSFGRQVQPILDEHCVRCHNRDAKAKEETSLSLESTAEFDETTKKFWSDAYLALADPRVSDRLNPQTAPPMLPPYLAGAANSPLMRLLTEGHEGVQLSDAELRRIACWIDLVVPYAGTYTEGMKPEDAALYDLYQRKRDAWAAEEARNIRKWLEEQNR